MHSAAFDFATVCPAIFLACRALALRHLKPVLRLALDLAILILSVPFAATLIGWALNFPANPGDHNPGIGLAFFGFAAVWLMCALYWLLRVVFAVFRHAKSAE